jgi:hypothetical protein
VHVGLEEGEHALVKTARGVGPPTICEEHGEVVQRRREVGVSAAEQVLE